MNLLEIILLALIQGAAELLPVSSSAHVIFAERLMGIDPSSPEATFLLVMLHTGTMFAVLVYFWRRWQPLLFPPPGANSVSGRFAFVKMIIVATAVTGVLGLGLKLLIEKVVLERMLGYPEGEVEILFKQLPLIAAALFLVGLFILAAGMYDSPGGKDEITTSSATWIGLVQGLCLPFRGFSRSGATISTALIRGISRPRAEDFSFALAVVLTPPVIVLELRRLLKKGWHPETDWLQLIAPGLLGMVFSFLAGLLALWLLSWALEKGKWRYFGYYCLVAALVIAGRAAWEETFMR